jgi:hypothetical protein
MDRWYSSRRLYGSQSSNLSVSMHADPLRIGNIANGRHAYNIADLSLLRQATAQTNDPPPPPRLAPGRPPPSRLTCWMVLRRAGQTHQLVEVRAISLTGWPGSARPDGRQRSLPTTLCHFFAAASDIEAAAKQNQDRPGQEKETSVIKTVSGTISDTILASPLRGTGQLFLGPAQKVECDCRFRSAGKQKIWPGTARGHVPSTWFSPCGRLLVFRTGQESRVGLIIPD